MPYTSPDWARWLFLGIYFQTTTEVFLNLKRLRAIRSGFEPENSYIDCQRIALIGKKRCKNKIE
jgi:hypothetical protein